MSFETIIDIKLKTKIMTDHDVHEEGGFNWSLLYRVGVVLGVMSLLPPTAGNIGMIFALGSLIPLEIWDVMVAIKLWRMANGSFLKPVSN
jgi:hypothetical protein